MVPTSTVDWMKTSGGPEAPRPFLASPERVSQYVELKAEEVTSQMKSLEGRQQLFRQLMEKEEEIRQDHSDFHPEMLRSQLDAAGEALLANERYLQDISSPEKKGIFSRAWQSIKSFPKKHPVVTTLLAAAAVAGSIAGGLYLAGYWETVLTAVGLDKIAGIAEAAGELTPVTPDTVPLPGGGIYDVPPPMPGPGEFPDIPH